MKLLEYAVFAWCVAGAAVSADALTLAEAQGRIGEVLDNPVQMTAIVSELPPADQSVYVGRVFKAIGELPDTVEEKAAKFMAVGKAAVRGAAKSVLADVVAAVFASADVEALMLINERFAAELFSRQTAGGKQVDDAKMKAIAANVMSKVQEATSGRDDAGVRDTFAVLMLLRTSGGTPADLRDGLVAMLPEEVRDDAREVWIPQALGEGVAKSYAQMLAAADVQEPAAGFEDAVAGSLLLPTAHGVIPVQLFDLAAGVDAKGKPATPFSEAIYLENDSYALPDSLTGGLGRVPRTLDKDSPAYGGYRRGGGFKGSNGAGGAGEPGGYPWQRMR